MCDVNFFFFFAGSFNHSILGLSTRANDAIFGKKIGNPAEIGFLGRGGSRSLGRFRDMGAMGPINCKSNGSSKLMNLPVRKWGFYSTKEGWVAATRQAAAAIPPQFQAAQAPRVPFPEQARPELRPRPHPCHERSLSVRPSVRPSTLDQAAKPKPCTLPLVMVWWWEGGRE